MDNPGKLPTLSTHDKQNKTRNNKN